MKNLMFKIKWLIKFRLSLKNIEGKNIAIVVDKFIDDNAGREALRLYNLYLSRGYQAFVLCAFNQAPMGKFLKDIRHIYIFNNSPEIFVKFCEKHKINTLHYVDKDIMVNAAHQFGFKTIFSLCDLKDPGLCGRLNAIDKVVFADSDIDDFYIGHGFSGQSFIGNPEKNFINN
ncbi:MAG: hypothetical protein IKY30_01550 [Oscillospiraceae bacterium]|nr:hypothetical protein [Oscillospiraceae bacterium]